MLCSHRYMIVLLSSGSGGNYYAYAHKDGGDRMIVSGWCPTCGALRTENSVWIMPKRRNKDYEQEQERGV